MRKKIKIPLIIIAGSLIIGIITLFAIGLTNNKSTTSKSGVTRVGQKAPDFELLSIKDSNKIILSEYIGNPIILNFWASWCPPCREESELLEKTHLEYSNQKIKFIGINIQDTEVEAKYYIEKYNITYPNGMDLNGRITIDYGVIGLPVTFFINKEGIIKTRWVGAISEAELYSNINKISKP